MYKWKLEKFEGEPEKVAKELKSMDGEITKVKIVTYAKLHPDSELHKCFNWNDESAALYWRYEQARQIMKSLVIVKEVSKGAEKISLNIRVFESVLEDPLEKNSKDRKYIELETALDDEYLRKEIIEGIIILLQQAQKKLSKYNMLIAEHGIINDKLEDTIKQIQLAM